MKKIILLILLMIPFLIAQQAVYDNVVDIAWDAVAPDVGTTITYEIFYAPFQNQSSYTVVGETASLEYTISIADAGDWVVGIRTVRTIDATGQRQYSPINWSHENGAWTPDPFYLRYYGPSPDAPANLRRV